MKEWFKKTHPLNLVMLVLGVLAIVFCICDGNWTAAIWAFNTICWVLIATFFENDNKDLRKEIQDLYLELMKKEKEE